MDSLRGSAAISFQVWLIVGEDEEDAELRRIHPLSSDQMLASQGSRTVKSNRPGFLYCRLISL